MSLFLLIFFAFFAGLIDGISGGGGLIQLPALILFGPAHLAHPTILGTNKLAAFIGTSASAFTFAKRSLVPWGLALRTALVAALASFLGSKAIALLPPEDFKPVVLCLLTLVAIYTFIKKDLGSQKNNAPQSVRLDRALISGALVGFYDGFFGPGTGSFFIFLFVSWVGLNFLNASAAAKISNLGTNFGSLVYFAFTSNIVYSIALPMAAANLLGSAIGARTAIKRGNEFVRIIFLCVVSLFILRLLYEVCLG